MGAEGILLAPPWVSEHWVNGERWLQLSEGFQGLLQEVACLPWEVLLGELH